jgi:hypothetical protein
VPAASIILPEWLEDESHMDSMIEHERNEPDCRCHICEFDIV